MSVFKRNGSQVYQFKFKYRGATYRGTTGQLSREAAKTFERKEQMRVREEAAGLAAPAPIVSPTFQDFAEIYYKHAAPRVKRPERIEDLTRVALRFWGRRPARDTTNDPARPYHDLRLSDVVSDPKWLLRWEEWLERPKTEAARIWKTKRGRVIPFAPKVKTWSGQTKNQYRSWLSRLFHLAISPAYRLQTGLISNPMVGTWRDSTKGREVALDADDVRAIVAAAAPHLRLAIAIGILAPKLREANILALEFDHHIDRHYKFIRVDDHKTAGATSAPLVMPIVEQLRAILVDARRRSPRRARVITYQRKPIKDLRGSVKAAVERAAVDRPHLRYGRFVENGVTFHTLRHTAATLMAELDVSPEKRQQAMGHTQLATTMKYTHLRPIGERGALEQLSAAVPLADLLIGVGAQSVPPTESKSPKFFGKARNPPVLKFRDKQKSSA